MDANVTASQSEQDHDNSSLQNPSTNPAEAGTTDETRDEDHETSSIEALNWSEVEEEELAAAQQQASKAASATQDKLPKLELETKVNNKADKDDESGTNNGSSANDEGSVLSTSLLQSINSSVSDEDPQARKQSVIENWASEVTNAVERGEIEMTEDFPDENETTGDDEEDERKDDNNEGVRKRKKLSPQLVSGMLSSASNGESNIDPLSNAPVLDDGPIWNKGPRTYIFQANRPFNQKLTFVLLFAVVLAIGLGLGNLVAHQECEAEHKASQQSQIKHTDKISEPTVPSTTTPAPIIPDRSTDSSMAGSSLPRKQPIPYVHSPVPEERAVNDPSTPSEKKVQETPQQRPVDRLNEGRPRRRDEPVIDPKYKTHAETVRSVVHTLDRLSREIDQFENTTRKLQGVLMIPDEEQTREKPEESMSLFDEEIHRDDDVEANVKNDNDEDSLNDSDSESLDEEEENEQAIIENLIDAIEQTPDYLEMKMHEKKWEQYDKTRRHSKIFEADPEDRINDPEWDQQVELITKSIQQFKDFERRFIKKERKRLREEGKFSRLSWRLPEEYTAEEKNALRVRYRSTWQEFLKSIKAKVPDPIEALFGVEEEDKEERTYGDILHFPFPDPDRDLTDEERSAWFKQNLEEADRERRLDRAEADKKNNHEEKSVTTTEDLILAETKPHEEVDDDLIITESVEEPLESTESSPSASSQQENDVVEQVQVQVDSTISGKSIDEASLVNAEIEIPLKSAAKSETGRLELEKVKQESMAKPKSSLVVKPKKSASKVASSDAVNGKKSQGTSPIEKAKNGKPDQKQKEQNGKQGKQPQKVKNGSNSGNTGSNPIPNAKSSGSGKISSKGKNLKNLESNKAFENVKGKSDDKRRAASPEIQPQGKFGAAADTKSSHLKSNKNERDSTISKKFTTGSTNYNKKEGFSGEHSDTSSAANIKKTIRQTQNEHDSNDNQKTKLNSNGRNYKNHPNNEPKQYDSKDIREQKQRRQGSQTRNEKKPDLPSERRFVKSNNRENEISSSKETQFQQKKAKDEQNHYRNYDLGVNQNGKRSQNRQSREKTDRRVKSREKDSSWGN